MFPFSVVNFMVKILVKILVKIIYLVVFSSCLVKEKDLCEKMKYFVKSCGGEQKSFCVRMQI